MWNVYKEIEVYSLRENPDKADAANDNSAAERTDEPETADEFPAGLLSLY